VERRFGEAKPERITEVAAELVRLKVNVIVTSTDGARLFPPRRGMR